MLISLIFTSHIHQILFRVLLFPFTPHLNIFFYFDDDEEHWAAQETIFMKMKPSFSSFQNSQ